MRHWAKEKSTAFVKKSCKTNKFYESTLFYGNDKLRRSQKVYQKVAAGKVTKTANPGLSPLLQACLSSQAGCIFPICAGKICN
jgi:hypothetical protein